MSIIFKCGRESATMKESTKKKASLSLPWRSLEEVSLKNEKFLEWSWREGRRNHMGKNTSIAYVCLEHRGQNM